MLITRLRLKNFQSFGPTPTTIELERLTYVLGPNGAGKTAVLEALSRLFSPLTAQRSIRVDDFHVPAGQTGATVHATQPELWIEADIELPESGDSEPHASVPPNFTHLRLESADGVPRIRVRLTATLDAAHEIDEQLEYILQADANGTPTQRKTMSRLDRRQIEVYYLPARRDPAEHIAYTASSLIGRTLRAADWNTQRQALTTLSGQLTTELGANGAVVAIGTKLTSEWSGLHSGTFFSDPIVAFGEGDLEAVLRQLTVNFSPSHGGVPLPFDRLSDGQKSLLYLSLVLAWQGLARSVLDGNDTSLDIDRLQPPVHAVVALEEPENSLAPYYLGRIIRQLRGACEHGDAQALIATHAPAMLRRVPPEHVCFLRLNSARESTVHRITLPTNDEEAAKYVREAIQAYPELYFSRLVVLGEGASELVVLPRLLAAFGIAEDDASVSVVPLGGRHVNHLWRLLASLEIPYLTLLDLDAGRHQGGWGRVRNAAKQINAIQTPPAFTSAQLETIPGWDADTDFPTFGDQSRWLDTLEAYGVFFSAPLDLDLMMLGAYPTAYGAGAADPDADTITAVLGQSHTNEVRLADQLTLLKDYHAKFDLHSKPATHLAALSQLTDDTLKQPLPDPLARLIAAIQARLAGLPE